jgi:hypothetical protein
MLGAAESGTPDVSRFGTPDNVTVGRIIPTTTPDRRARSVRPAQRSSLQSLGLDDRVGKMVAFAVAALNLVANELTG